MTSQTWTLTALQHEDDKSQVLIGGPNRREVIVPPGVTFTEPEGSPDICSEVGWRHARYAWRNGLPDWDEIPLQVVRLDQVETLRLLSVANLQPECWLIGWFAQRIALLRTDASAKEELEDLLIDATCALGGDWVRNLTGCLRS